MQARCVEAHRTRRGRPSAAVPMSDLVRLWGVLLGTFIGLLPIVDPLTAAPTFLAITEGQSEERRR